MIFSGGSTVVKNPPANAEDTGLIPGLGRFPWSKKWQSTLAVLPAQKSLASYSPWDHKRVGHDLATKQQKQHRISMNSTNIGHFGLLAKELLAWLKLESQKVSWSLTVRRLWG